MATVPLQDSSASPSPNVDIDLSSIELGGVFSRREHEEQLEMLDADEKSCFCNRSR
jgi:hypothetical protein